MNPDFWKKKKVFLTGHTGFKGSWSVLWLKILGAEITGYSLKPPTEPNLFETARVSQGIHSYAGDVGDFHFLKTVLAAAKPDIVIHMAAQSLVRESYRDPVMTYATNVLGTVHLFEAIRQLPGKPVVINVTSDKCYENKEWLWGYREDEPLGGVDPYSSSKACSELVTSAYRSSFFHPKNFESHGIALASARAGNVIGGGDWARDRLVPDIIQALMQGSEVSIRNPHAVRPWQHVLEPLNGYFTLAEKLFENRAEYAESWNFGPNEEGAKSVSWIADQLHSLWAGKSSWKQDAKSHPREANYLKLECAKARTRLGWKPKLDLDSALRWVVDWYQAYVAGEDMCPVTEQQIRNFMHLDLPVKIQDALNLKDENVSCL